jgi:hypothetical protein
MKSLSICGVAVIMVVAPMLVSSVAVAQDGNAQNSLVDGKSALLFEVNGDFDLTSFEGATVSLKHHHADNRAYRASITVNLASQDSESQAGGPSASYSSDSYELSLFLNRLYYHSPGSATTVFYGFGPRAGLSGQKSTNVNLVNGIRQEFTTDGWDVGLVARFHGSSGIGQPDGDGTLGIRSGRCAVRRFVVLVIQPPQGRIAHSPPASCDLAYPIAFVGSGTIAYISWLTHRRYRWYKPTEAKQE